MKAFNQLTRLGQLRRIRIIADKAIQRFGLPEARLQFVHQAGNILYRVILPNPSHSTNDGDLFVEGHYLLRLHQPGYQDPKAIAFELDWLASMRREANLPVPEPVPSQDGSYLIELEDPGVPGRRNCSMLKWVRGRLVKSPKPEHFYSQGKLFAEMHNHASGYMPVGHEAKRRFDWKGLFQDDSGNGILSSKVWGMFPEPYIKPFSTISDQVKELMAEWGTDRNIFGLIHGDLGADANGIFYRGQARAIDFDDSGFGYYAYDLSVALEHIWDHVNYQLYRDALLEGYNSVRALPQEQAEQIDLFLAALNVYISLWAQGSRERYHRYWESDLLPRIERALKYVNMYLNAN